MQENLKLPVIYRKFLTVERFVENICCIILVDTISNVTIVYLCFLAETSRNAEEDLTIEKAVLRRANADQLLVLREEDI